MKNNRIKAIIQHFKNRGIELNAQQICFAQKMTDQHANLSDEIIIDFTKMLEMYKNNPNGKINWDFLQELNPNDKKIFSDIEHNAQLLLHGQSLISQTVILKLNGGLGTTMGLSGMKSKIIVDTINNKSFLDFINNHIEVLRNHDPSFQLWLLNSFYTQQETRKYLKNYEEILQNKFPKIDISPDENGHPKNIPFAYPDDPELEWNPPGHGDIYHCLQSDNYLNDLIVSGKKYLFISNADNLGATLDFSILGYMDQHKIDFLIETTPKTQADIKGGTVVRYQDQLFLLERAQVPQSYIPEFEDIKKFSIFNTNNIWIHLPTLKKMIESDAFTLPLIINQKMVNQTPVIQLETAMGAAIHFFKNAKVLVVPRTRFFPVKSTADLLLIRSDFTNKLFDKIEINPLRINKSDYPTIQLSSEFADYAQFSSRIQSIPSLLNLRSLTISGDIEILPGITPVFEEQVILESPDEKLKIIDSIFLKNIRIYIKNHIPEIESFDQEAILFRDQEPQLNIIRYQNLSKKLYLFYQENTWRLSSSTAMFNP